MEIVDSVAAFVAANKWWFLVAIPLVLAIAVVKGRG